MTNENKKINELVADDDDPTSELEVLPVLLPEDIESELAATTSGLRESASEPGAESIAGLQSALKSRSDTIGQLQFEIEQLRARLQGLEAEVSAREKIAIKLNQDIDDFQKELTQKSQLLKSRDETIRSLTAEIRERYEAELALQQSADELRSELEHARNAERELDADGLKQRLALQEERILELERDNETLARRASAEEADKARNDRQLMAEQTGQLVSNKALIKQLQEQLARSDQYADSLRQQLQEAQTTAAAAEQARGFLQQSLDIQTEKSADLNSQLQSMAGGSAELEQQLEEQRVAHDEQIRTLRFELGEAEETVTQHELVAEQLATDLVENRGVRIELESMLTRIEESSKAQIEELEKENRKLQHELQEAEEKLDTRNESINCLLTELAKKSRPMDSIGEIEHVIQGIDERVSERIDDRSSPQEKDRVTRVLVGAVEGQELRFPLFKDRLTIGRTEQNDIQLKAAYISRRHAVIVTDDDRTRIMDWGSKNGVFVNSERITEHFLRNGDIVGIGTAKFRYEERPKRDN